MTTRKPSTKRTSQRAPHLATASVVREHGEEIAQLLYDAFGEYNRTFFDDRLGAPLILITQAKSARTGGDYCPRDVHGLESRIRIAPAMLKRGEVYVLDILLHEMIHAWQHEVDGNLEDGYRGHGPRFAAKCNEIGARLGLGPVSVKGREGLPDCAHWPSNVRPAGYYPIDWRRPTRAPRAGRRGGSPEGQAEAGERDGSSGDRWSSLRAMLSRASRDELDELVAVVSAEIAKRDDGDEAAEAAE